MVKGGLVNVGNVYVKGYWWWKWGIFILGKSRELMVLLF